MSQFYNTPCFPAGAGPDYVNAVFEWATDLEPREILSALHDVEAQFGRERRERWGQRTLDLDLIAVGQTVHPDTETVQNWMDLALDEQRVQAPDGLVLPHPRVQDRAFVLVPLCDIAPDWRHPVLGHTAREMCDALPSDARNSVKPLVNQPKRP